MIADGSLRFFLDYVEHEGGLCEEDEERARVLLPLGLQRRLQLPEASTLTFDPEVADDESATLLVPGHPALDAAATHVLAQGDVGRCYLPWPTSAPPALAALAGQARERVGIDHGRIDPEHDPAPEYYPLLRIGALVTYTLDERFQEREEILMDARAFALVEDARRCFLAKPALRAADMRHSPLRPDLVRAVAAGHAALCERAVLRADALQRQARGALHAERARVEAYYAAVLASIASRRENAEPRRQALLDAQANATHVERERRLHEIDAKFRAAWEITPFRLHLLFAPALALRVIVRRGDRRYPLRLDWLLAAGRFAALRCPNCDTLAPLVAGRSLLGCRQCLGRPEG
ncbi:MAG: hypothetical protein ACLPYS_16995 [Vulcanimicrobiaceae bacterium]